MYTEVMNSSHLIYLACKLGERTGKGSFISTGQRLETRCMNIFLENGGSYLGSHKVQEL